MLLIPGDKLILHSVMKDSLLMAKHPEFHYGCRYWGSAKVLLQRRRGCKSLKLSSVEDGREFCSPPPHAPTHRPPSSPPSPPDKPKIWPRTFSAAILPKLTPPQSKSQTECSLFFKPVQPFLRKKTKKKTITLDILHPPCFFSLKVFPEK